MTQSGFHVTHQSNVENIKKHGLTPKESGDWRQKRKELRSTVDEYANPKNTEWVNRQGAVYFWSTIQDALDFIEENFGHGANLVIIEFDLSQYDVWMGNSNFIEDLYYDWMNEGHIKYDLSQIETETAPWDGTETPGYELWCQPPVEPEAIHEVN